MFATSCAARPRHWISGSRVLGEFGTSAPPASTAGGREASGPTSGRALVAAPAPTVVGRAGRTDAGSSACYDDRREGWAFLMADPCPADGLGDPRPCGNGIRLLRRHDGAV